MILLSFDTEEFDVPREHGVDFPLDEAMKVSVYGTNRILDCLKKNEVKATFFCTSNFAENASEVMRRIIGGDDKTTRGEAIRICLDAGSWFGEAGARRGESGGWGLG